MLPKLNHILYKHTDVRKTSVPSPGTREDQLRSLSESIVTQLLLWGLRVYRFKDYINLEMNILSVWEVRMCVFFFPNASVWKSFLQLNGVIKGNNCCLHTESLHFIFHWKGRNDFSRVVVHQCWFFGWEKVLYFCLSQSSWNKRSNLLQFCPKCK